MQNGHKGQVPDAWDFSGCFQLWCMYFFRGPLQTGLESFLDAMNCIFICVSKQLCALVISILTEADRHWLKKQWWMAGHIGTWVWSVWEIVGTFLGCTRSLSHTHIPRSALAHTDTHSRTHTHTSIQTHTHTHIHTHTHSYSRLYSHSTAAETAHYNKLFLRLSGHACVCVLTNKKCYNHLWGQEGVTWPLTWRYQLGMLNKGWKQEMGEIGLDWVWQQLTSHNNFFYS